MAEPQPQGWQSFVTSQSWEPRATPASKAASCGKGDGRVWAAFVVFPGKRAQRFLLIIVFPDPQ